MADDHKNKVAHMS